MIGLVSESATEGTAVVSTESFIEASVNRVKAEADTDTAKALLTLQESAKKDLLWTLGFIVGVVGVATALILAVLA